jgi:hypothetical protein
MAANSFPMTRPPKGPLYAILGVVGVSLLVLAGFFLSFVARTPEAEVDAQSLRITKSYYGETIPRAELKVADAKILDLGKDSAYAPSRRQNGMSIPWVQQGWFQLQNGERALVFITDPSKVLYLPTTKGYSLLISTPDPAALLSSLK